MSKNRDMHLLWMSTLLAAAVLTAAQTAKFAVDGAATSASTIVATIQPRTAAPGYSWLRIYFYSSPLSAADRAQAAKGDIDSIQTRWAAVLQLTVDKNSTVWQVDLSLPGHTCTIAESDRAARNALQAFQFDGGRLRLKGKGTHACDMASLKVPNRKFEWDLEFEAPVVKRGPG